MPQSGPNYFLHFHKGKKEFNPRCGFQCNGFQHRFWNRQPKDGCQHSCIKCKS